jgi:trigger factor
VNHKTEITPDGDVTLQIEIPSEDITQRMVVALAKFAQTARIPGFRPGKAPLDMIRKRYGKELFADALDDLTRESFNMAIEAEKLEPAGRILIDQEEYKADEPYRFRARFPLKPKPSLNKYKGLHVVVNEAEITENDVAVQLESLQRRHAHLHSIDTPAPVNAILSVKVHEVHPSGLELIGRKVEEKQFEIGADTLGPGSDEQLIGVKAGETRVIRVRSDLGGITGAPQSGTILTPQQAANPNSHQPEFISLSVEVLQVGVPHLPDLDDDFAKQVNPNLETLEDLKGYARLTLMGYTASGSRQMLEHGLVHKLVEENPFHVPKMIVDSTLNDLADELKLAGDERKKFIDEHLHEAEFDYRWVLLRDLIAKEENVSVTDDEVEQELVRMSERSGETVSALKMRYKGEKLSNLKMNIYEHRVVQVLATHAEIEKRMMSLPEFLQVMGRD